MAHLDGRPDPAKEIQKRWGIFSPVERNRRSQAIDRTLTLLGIAVGIALYILPKTPLVVILGCLGIFACLIHPIWNTAWIEDAPLRRCCAALLLAGLCIGIGAISWPKGPLIEEVNERSISTSAYVAASGHNKGEVIAGFRWPQQEFYEIRLLINNESGLPLNNVDITIRAFNHGVIMGMGQLSNINGAEVHAPEFPVEDGIKLRSSDGSFITIMPQDAPVGPGLTSFPFGNWRVSSARLLNDHLRLAMSAFDPDSKSAPKALVVLISYDSRLDSRKRMSVRRTIDVSR